MKHPLPVIHHVKKNSTRISDVIPFEALGLWKQCTLFYYDLHPKSETFFRSYFQWKNAFIRYRKDCRNRMDKNTKYQTRHAFRIG